MPNNSPATTTQELRAQILKRLPEGTVMPQHTENEHFYAVDGHLYPSVTGKLTILKDKSLNNFNMNKAINYIFANYKKMDDNNVMQVLADAEKQARVVLEDAGDVGTRVHSYIEEYMEDYIKNGKYTDSATSYVPPHDPDLRCTSAMRAMQKFVEDYDYAPAVSELLVYSHKLRLAGTVDDIGLIKTVIKPHQPGCSKENCIVKGRIKRCVECGYKSRRDVALVDTKTSNQLKKIHYAYQVALYYEMLKEVTGIKVDKVLVVQLSKENGQYKVWELKRLPKLVRYAKAVLAVNDGNEFIKTMFDQSVKGDMIEL